MMWPFTRKYSSYSSPRLSAGISVTDTSLTWIILSKESTTYAIESYGDVALPEGVVEDGFIRDEDAFADMLREVCHSSAGIREAHVSFPAHAAVFFTMHIPSNIPADQVRNMIIFEMQMRVPMRSFDDVVTDYKVTEERGDESEIGVCVYPRSLFDGYRRAFAAAGVQMLSLEPATTALSLALLHSNDPVTALVDMGHTGMHVSLMKKGVPLFASNVSLPSDLPEHKARGLAEEAARRIALWRERRNAHGEPLSPIERIIVTGSRAGHQAHEGFVDNVTTHASIPTEHGNTWRHLFSLESTIPPITRTDSHHYAAAVGAALRELMEE